MNRFYSLLGAAFILILLLTGFNDSLSDISSIRFIGEYEVPYNFSFKETKVGGLSGIDYDSKNQIYYMISDDRAAINNVRFYTAKVLINDKGIDTVEFLSVTTMTQTDGTNYPDAKTDAAKTPDPEAIRFNPLEQKLMWTSEGERLVNDKIKTLNDPGIFIMGMNGKQLQSVNLPKNLSVHADETGPRRNGTLEGLTFSSDYKSFFTSLEVPLYEDGPEADLADNNALIRIYKFDYTTKRNTAQYAYKLEPVAYRAFPSSAFKVNGIPDILYLSETKLLVVERSFSTGRLPCTIKVFLADFSKADNVMNINSLRENPPANLVQKKLLLNMDDLGIYTDNIEGVTFGPNMPNGHKTLIFLSDNNFLPIEKTQLLLFEVIP